MIYLIVSYQVTTISDK